MTNYEDISKLNKFQKFFYGYGCYHNTFLNILVHIICVPPITFTLDKMLEYAFEGKLPINPFYLFFIIWGPMYAYVDPIVGTLTTLQYIVLSILTKGMQFPMFGLSHIQAMVAIHAISWIGQFIGHGAFEKRKPALLDNVLLLFSAPVFVNIELFYYLFGYRKNEIDETKKYIESNIKQYRESLNKKVE
jgi:uncharacterized membrane protein YGL010W